MCRSTAPVWRRAWLLPQDRANGLDHRGAIPLKPARLTVLSATARNNPHVPRILLRGPSRPNIPSPRLGRKADADVRVLRGEVWRSVPGDRGTQPIRVG